MTPRTTRGRDGQGGFALITVLAVIALTSVTIGALFGLLFTTMRVTEAQERSAREGRAADGAIESAINEMRDVPCDPTTPYLTGQLFNQQPLGDGDDVAVDVSCTPAGSATGSSIDQVRIVGTDGYQGAMRWTEACAAGAVTGCMPWSVVSSLQAGAAGSNTALVHSGPEPLAFSSGVTVRTGSVGLRSDANGTPAITVGGQYTQGAPGLGAAAGECGLLSGTPGNGAGTIEDLDDNPACDNASARQLDSDPSSGGTGLVASTNPVTAIPTTCAAPVMTFAARAYTAAETTAISRLTDGSVVSCRGRTFHFTPGIVSFNARQLRLGDPGSYYVFGQPAGWDPASGVQAAASIAGNADEPLCDAAASGTTVLIAGWTALNHTAGRVGICPNRPGAPGSDPLPAIYQQPVVPTEVSAAIDVPTVSNRIYVAFSCRSSGINYPVDTDLPSGFLGPCRPERTYNLELSTSGEAPIASLRVMLTGAENLGTPNNLITRRQSRFSVRRANGSQICTTEFVTGMPNGGLTSSFDLKELPGTCRTTALTQDQLNGSRIKVDHRMDLSARSVVQSIDIIKAQVEINAVSGRAISASSPASAGWNSPANVLTANAAVATPQMPCGDFVCPVADTGRTRTPQTPFNHGLSISNFSFPGLFNSSNPDLDPSIKTLRAVVKVKPSNARLPAAWNALFGNSIDVDNFLSPMRTFVELETPDGSRCITQGSGMNSDQEIAFDLLSADFEDPAAPSGCNVLALNNASQLTDPGVTLRVRFEMPCVPNWFHGVPFECLRSSLFYNPADTSPIWQIRPPDIEHIRLTTVTDTYSGRPPTSTVTVDAAGVASRAAFNVAGSAWMPFSDLDINWNGDATGAPLFASDLVLHGLGSRMGPAGKMGTVCCSPPDARTVDLIATIDGVERLTSRVKFVDVRIDAALNPVYEPGYGVEVLSWSRCPAGGCASVLGANQNSPP